MKKMICKNSFLGEIASLLREGQPVRVRIDGRSMLPFIVGGRDEVELVPYQGPSSLPLWGCAFYRWNGSYMVHRFVGEESGVYCMMGDGNLAQIERVEEKDIIGVLHTIYHPDGTVLDCLDKSWLRKGKYWFKCRRFRRYLLSFYRLITKTKPV